MGDWRYTGAPGDVWPVSRRLRGACPKFQAASSVPARHTSATCPRPPCHCGSVVPPLQDHLYHKQVCPEDVWPARACAHPGRDVRRRPERPRTVEQFPRADTPGALRDAGRPGPPRPTTVCCCLFVAGPSRGPVRKKGALCPSLWEPLGSGGKVGVRIVRIVSSWRMRPCPSPFLCAARRLASPLPQLCQLRRPPQRVHGRPPEKVHRRCFLM